MPTTTQPASTQPAFSLAIMDISDALSAESAGTAVVAAKTSPLSTTPEPKSKAQKKTKKKKGKQRTKDEPSKPPPIIHCKFWAEGRCAKGAECTFHHDPLLAPKRTELCKFYLSNVCRKGAECLFSHDTKAHPCRFFYLKGFCASQDQCRFSHDISPDVAKEVLLKQEQQTIIGTAEHCVESPTGPSGGPLLPSTEVPSSPAAETTLPPPPPSALAFVPTFGILDLKPQS